MSTQKNKLDDFFKNSFESAELKPADSSWQGIESKLLNDQADKDRGKIFFLRWLCAGSILLFISIGLIYLFNQSEKSVLTDKSHSRTIENKNQLKIEEKGNAPLFSSKENIEKNNLKQQNIENVIKEEPSITSNKIKKENKTEETVNAEALKKSLMEKRQNKSKPSVKKDNSISNNNGTLDDKKNEQQTHDIDNSIKEESKPSNINNIALNNIHEPSNIIKLDSLKSEIKKEELVTNSSDSIKKDSVEKIQLTEQSGTNVVKASQENKIKKNNWWIEAMYSFDYTYQKNVITESNMSNANIAAIKSTYEKYAKPKYGYTTGINVGYMFNDKWSLQTGIVYSSKGEKTDATILIDTSNSNLPVSNAISFADATVIDNNLASIFSSSALYSGTNIPVEFLVDSKKAVNYKYEYFDIPFIIGYDLGRRKLHFHASLGASASIFYRHQKVIINEDSKKDKTVIKTDSGIYKKIFYTALISLGAEYNLNRKFSLHLEPVFRYGLTSIVKRSPVNGYLHSFGITTGIRYYF